MNAQELLSIIQGILSDQLGLERDEVVPEANLREDLALDSVDAYDLLSAAQIRLSVRLDPGRFSMVSCVSDVVSILQEATAAEAAR